MPTSAGDVKVSAIRSTHIAGHASYRVDTPAGSVVIGGDAGELVLTVVATTVAMSVLAHGLSAGPLATWYSGRHPVDEQADSASMERG